MKTLVNENGEIIEVCINDNYLLKGKEKAVDFINNALTSTNGIMHPPLKPRWDGAKWIDLATEKELQEAYPLIAHVPGLEERTAAAEAAIMAIMGDMQNV